MDGATSLEVLIADDHEAMRTLLRKILERAGVQDIREAATGHDALALLRQRPAHLILADRNMPGGPDLVARVRANHSGTRIITITGDVRAETSGADALLVKPVSPRDLLAAIERVLS